MGELGSCWVWGLSAVASREQKAAGVGRGEAPGSGAVPGRSGVPGGASWA